MRYLPLFAVIFLAGCNSEIYVRDGVTDGDTFYLAPAALVDSDPVLQSWVVYSLTKSVCQLKLGGENPARRNSYECELKARSELVEDWGERQAADATISDAYLDELSTVSDAGFLGAYTARYFASDDWQVPGDVDVEAFDDWRRQHLRGHRPQTRIVGSWGYKAER